MADNLMDMQSICEGISSLSKLAVEQYTPLVDEIISQKITDEHHIESTLDRLLDVCFDNKILFLYRKLCKYYYDINSQATIEYIDYYKKMYDSDCIEFDNLRPSENQLFGNSEQFKKAMK